MARARFCVAVTALALVLLTVSSLAVHALDGDELLNSASNETSLVLTAPDAIEMSSAVDTEQSSSLAAHGGAAGDDDSHQQPAAAFDADEAVTSATDPLEALKTKASASTHQQQQQTENSQSSLLPTAATTSAGDNEPKSSATTTISSDSALVGAQSAFILVTGAAVLVVLAVAFKRQTSAASSSSNKKYERGTSSHVLALEGMMTYTMTVCRHTGPADAEPAVQRPRLRGHVSSSPLAQDSKSPSTIKKQHLATF